MKKTLFLILMIVSMMPLSFAAESERYQYIENQQLVFDSASGKIYRFIQKKDDIKHVEIDYVTGVVKIDGAIRASGTFDYRDLEEEVILAKV